MALLLSLSMMTNSAMAQAVESIRLAQAVTPSSPTAPPTRDWGAEIDIDPPVIDHEALETGVPGQSQKFSAVVVDDRGLKHVWLFHRAKSGAQYASVAMEQVGETSEFTVAIDTSLGQNRIEYYIEAVDIGGNRVLKGFPFFPLVRQLGSGTAETSAQPEPAASTTESQTKIMYVLLGVAAVALGVALLGGDDNKPSDGGTGPVDPDTVPLTIIAVPPE